MSRQNNQIQKDRKTEGSKNDAASNAGRSYSRSDKEPREYAPRHRDETRPVSGLNRFTLNDLYERSSI